MDWIHNLLTTSWLSTVEGPFGLNGWWLLLIGSGIWVVIMTILAVLSTVRANRLQAAGNTTGADQARARRSLFVSLAILVPFVALCLLAWPFFWMIPIVALVLGLVILLILFRHAVKFMIGVAIGLVVALLLVMFIVLFGGNPFASKICLDEQGQPVASHSYTLDVDGGKFGPAMVSTDKESFITELVGRMCQDKALAAAEYVSAGFEPVSDANNVLARFSVSQAEWFEGVATVKQFMEESSFSYGEPVPHGTPSLYMVDDANGNITIKQGSTVGDGTLAVFTHPDGRVLKLRIECGAQPVFDTPPPLPPCEEGQCPPPVCPYNPALPPDSPDCLQSKDPNDDVESPDGWTQLPSGSLTTGNESEEQQESGDVSGNVTDNTVPNDTSTGDTTTELPSGTTTAPGGTSGGDTTTDDTVDETVTNQDDGGTNGDTEIQEPAD